MWLPCRRKFGSTKSSPPTPNIAFTWILIIWRRIKSIKCLMWRDGTGWPWVLFFGDEKCLIWSFSYCGSPWAVNLISCLLHLLLISVEIGSHNQGRAGRWSWADFVHRHFTITQERCRWWSFPAAQTGFSMNRRAGMMNTEAFITTKTSTIVVNSFLAEEVLCKGLELFKRWKDILSPTESSW